MALAHKRILVIGGTSGFGLAAAKLAAQAGAHVHLVGRNEVRLQRALTTVTGAAISKLDASDADQLTAFFARHEPYDHLISMLGGAMGGGFLAADMADIRQTIEAKFFANLQLARVAVPHLNTGGSLTFTSGSGGHAYDASGAVIGNQAINTLVAGLAVECAPRLRVNAVSPTWTPTGLWAGMTPNQLAQQAANFAQGIPLERIGTIDEVAQAYIFALTNTFMTGQVLRVDGGVDL